MLWIFFFFIVCKIYFLSVLILFEHDETQTFTRPNFESGKLWCLFAKRWTTFCLASSCTAFSQAFASIGFGDVSQTNGPEEPRQKQSAHAFGSAAECLLILAELQGVVTWSFVNFYVQQETEGAHYMIEFAIRTISIILIKYKLSQRRCLLLRLGNCIVASLPQFSTKEQLL